MLKEIDTISTERLLLRGILEDDAKEIVGWRSDPEVYKYFKSPHKISVEEHLNWFNNSYLYNENRFDWICIRKKDGKKIGVFGIVTDDEKVEINYLLDSGAQHKGYAKEGISALVKYARENFGGKLIVAEIHKNNLPSIAVVSKLGFKLISSHDDFVIYGIR